MNAKPRIKTLNRIESLESRLCLSAVVFLESQIGHTDELKSLEIDIRATDIDGDLDLDIVLSNGGDISWYENNDANGEFSARTIIADTSRFVEQIDVIDVGQDVDVDVMVAYRDGISWLIPRAADSLFDRANKVAGKHA